MHAKGGLIAEGNGAFDDEGEAEDICAQPNAITWAAKPKPDARDPRPQLRVSKYISLRQAKNIIEAVRFAKLIGLPLVAHLTIHWSLTDVGDDPNGKLFAKGREGLDKLLNRHGIKFAAVWARERQSRGQSDVVHCHLMFHLPAEYRKGKKLREVETAISRLIERHGRGLRMRGPSSW